MTNHPGYRDIEPYSIELAAQVRYDLSVTQPSNPESWPTLPEQAILRSSFARMIPESDKAVASFYDNLFALHPEVRPMFTTDLESLHEKFMMMLAWFLDHMDRPESAVQECRRLGDRHRAYGTQPGHYGPVGEILIQSLTASAGLGPEEVKAWTKVYGIMSDLMLANEPSAS